MSMIQHTDKERDMLARIMRAEATGEGDLGQLMVGNVILNRAIANCLDFKNVRTIQQVIYQSPGGFEGRNSPLFFSNPTTMERRLADKVLRGEYYHPATHALWFYAPSKGASCQTQWWGQYNAGRYKGHCFYVPAPGECHEIR